MCFPPVLVCAEPRFEDNGDGTITDTKTDLMWEKKSDDGSIHDKDNVYTWSAEEGTELDGSAYTKFIKALNDTRFAGHSDWRMPTLRELETLGDSERIAPAVGPVFDNNCKEGCGITECSCTAPRSYWSSTTNPDSPRGVLLFGFGLGGVTRYTKRSLNHVRAVRGSL